MFSRFSRSLCDSRLLKQPACNIGRVCNLAGLAIRQCADPVCTEAPDGLSLLAIRPEIDQPFPDFHAACLQIALGNIPLSIGIFDIESPEIGDFLIGKSNRRGWRRGLRLGRFSRPTFWCGRAPRYDAVDHRKANGDACQRRAKSNTHYTTPKLNSPKPYLTAREAAATLAEAPISARAANRAEGFSDARAHTFGARQ